MHRIFVYGSLKEGHCNFHVNQGRRVAGDFVTVERYALYILGDENLPWLVPAATDGHFVVGQLFEVDDQTLANMDQLERIDEALWYRRVAIDVQARAGGAGGAGGPAWVYLGNHERLQVEAVRAGPVAEYTAALAAAHPLALDD